MPPSRGSTSLPLYDQLSDICLCFRYAQQAGYVQYGDRFLVVDGESNTVFEWDAEADEFTVFNSGQISSLVEYGQQVRHARRRQGFQLLNQEMIITLTRAQNDQF